MSASYYVRRIQHVPDGRQAYVGPLPSWARARAEAAAWEELGGWQAEILANTPETRAKVRAWEKAVRERREAGR